ncbi:MAG TPA: hypothetical protein VGO47_10760, partial [Chlamydiales bacterium]|nr:hypothetical protein [Chlamydiales bacterium]
MAIQQPTTTSATVTQVSRASLYRTSKSYGRMSMDASRAEEAKRKALDDKTQSVWSKVRAQFPDAKGVKLNLSKLYISYKDSSGKEHHVNLGHRVDPANVALQADFEDLRTAVSGVWKDSRWDAQADDSSNRPLRGKASFTAEEAPKDLCKSPEQ